MVGIEEIPVDLRWEMAAKSATAMPLVYDMFFRKALGDKFEEIELAIWMEGGKELKSLARALGLPSGDAREIQEALYTVSQVLYGPELMSEVVEESEEVAISRMTGCPFLNRALELGLDPEKLVTPCHAYLRSAVENLNQRYTQTFEKSMCSGDPHCEPVIHRHG